MFSMTKGVANSQTLLPIQIIKDFGLPQSSMGRVSDRGPWQATAS